MFPEMIMFFHLLHRNFFKVLFAFGIKSVLFYVYLSKYLKYHIRNVNVQGGGTG